MLSRSRARRLRAFPWLFLATTLLTAVLLTAMGKSSRADITAVGTNFWFQGQSGASTWTGEKPFQDNVNFATATDPWNPTFIAEMTPYGVIRFMDWNCTNNSGQVSWSTRKAKTSSDQTAGYYSTNAPGGVAIEWMIDLCNRTGKDMWICLPHKANEDYAFQMATLIKNTLNASRKVYVEYSNEVWNGGFEQTGYCNQQGVAMGFDSDTWTAGSKYYTYAATKLFHQFDLVFAGSSSRLVKVLAGQRTNDGGGLYHLTVRLDALNNATTNPFGVQVNAISVAAYFGDSVNGNSGTVWSDLDASITATANSLTQFRQLADQRGLQFVGYEGGQHLLTNADVLNRDSRMYDRYITWLNAIKPKYNGVFVHYAHGGTFSAGGAWGSKETTGQAESTAHKYRALKTWIASNIGGGTTIPSAPTGLSATPGNAQVSLSWTASSGATSYNVKRSQTSGGPYSNVATGLTGTTYTNTGLQNGITYYFVVSAVNSAGESGNSNQSSAMPTAGGTGTPATLNPTDDRDTQSDNAAGTNADISASQFNTIYLKFNLASITGTISDAKLRIYKNDTTAGVTALLSRANSDAWTQSTAVGSLPAIGSLITSVAAPSTVGYIEFPITSVVQTEVNGDKVLSLALQTNQGFWTHFLSKEGASQPQLVINGGAGSQVAAPTFSPGGGTYTSSQNVTISSATSGASIRYTTNGTNPTSTTGTVYSGPVNIAATSTLKAIAYKSGMTDSTVTTATYTINSAPTTVTLTATEDRDTQSDNAAGTNTQISCSQYNTIYLKFSLASVTGTITNAKLRLYKNDATSNLTVNALSVASDSWTQATAVGSLPAVGSGIGSAVVPNAVGYVEIDITSGVQAQYSGDKVISVAVTTPLGSWTWFQSKEGANAPQILVTRQ